MKAFFNRLRGFFLGKKGRYGGYSLALAVIVITVIILINVGANAIESKWALRVDLTKNRAFSMSDETNRLVGELAEDVNIYTLYPAGSTDEVVQGILERYASLSEHVNLVNIDPITNPLFTAQFASGDETAIANYSVIVANADNTRFRIYAPTEFTASTNYSNVTQQLTERKITTGIVYVTTKNLTKLHFLQGHQEVGLNYIKNLSNSLKEYGYDIVELTLTPDTVLSEGDIVVVLSPQKDLSDSDRDMLLKFLQDGGRMYMEMDPATDADIPNFDSLLAYYDVSFGKGYIVEDVNTASLWNRSPLFIIPELEDHVINTSMIEAQSRVLLEYARPVNVPTFEQTGIQVYPLMSTSSKSFLRYQNVASTADLIKQDTDPSGPFTTALSIQRTNALNPELETRIVLVGSKLFETAYNYSSQYGTLTFAGNVLNWLSTEETKLNVTVEGKYNVVPALNITDASTQIWLAIFVVGIIPGLIFIGGVVVWARRRHK